MDREWGAQDALAFVRRTDFAPSAVAFDAAMQKEHEQSEVGLSRGPRRRRGDDRRDRRRHARLRVHGQGALERLPEARLHDLAAAARAAAGRDRRAQRGGGRRGRAPLRLRARTYRLARAASPTRRSSSSTTAGRTTCTPSRRSPRPRRASTSSARSRSGATPTRATRSGSASQATGVKHMCAFNYRFVPAVRLAREMIEAGELGEIHHFRGRYLQDWGDDRRRGLALRQGRGGLGRARRPRRARHRPRALPRRRDRRRLGARRDVPARAARSTTRSRPRSSSRTARSARSRRRASRPGRKNAFSGRSTARRARSPSTWSG